ncbi:MAG: EFR1 family ferrodoxin [Eggerthellaceae bacterium]|jgi:ferredoxin/flavodoxin|nr:EFR1 family ferrodoxin [Eggerthellaceae bacterium]MCH4220458.1 EFR1 family ferrodoxin [Eggerthellaceae bacterium]
MIFYFSATGNSLAAARSIAAVSKDTISDIGHATKCSAYNFFMQQGENLGFVFPVYAWSTPRIVDEFVKKVHFITGNGKPFVPGYCYVVITCGSEVGSAARFFEEELSHYRSIRLDASYSIQTVGNCIYLYEPAQGAKQEKALAKADRQIKDVAYHIDGKRMVHQEHRGTVGAIASHFTNKSAKSYSVEPFHVDSELCNGCGICVAVCPTNTISLRSGAPVWEGSECTQCLACIHRCPCNASQFGKKTARRSRYLNPVMASVVTPHASVRFGEEDPDEPVYIPMIVKKDVKKRHSNIKNARQRISAFTAHARRGKEHTYPYADKTAALQRLRRQNARKRQFPDDIDDASNADNTNSVDNTSETQSDKKTK